MPKVRLRIALQRPTKTNQKCTTDTQDVTEAKAAEISTQLTDYIKQSKELTSTVVKQSSEVAYSNHILFSKTGFVCDASVYVYDASSFYVSCVKQAAAQAAV